MYLESGRKLNFCYSISESRQIWKQRSMDAYFEVDIVHNNWLPRALLEPQTFIFSFPYSLLYVQCDLSSTCQTH